MLVDTTSVPAFHLKTLMHKTRIYWVMDMMNYNPRQGQPQVPSPEFEDLLVVSNTGPLIQLTPDR